MMEWPKTAAKTRNNEQDILAPLWAFLRPLVSGHPCRDAVDDSVLRRPERMLELGREWHRQVERGDPQRCRFERREVVLGELRHELGAKPVGTATLVQHDQPARLHQRGADRVELQR